jgi:hypothetical protein
VQVQDIDVRGLQLLERVLDRDAEGFGAVASKVRLDLFLLVFSIGAGELGGNDHLVTAITCGQPLAEPLLGLAVLVAICGIDEIAAETFEGVEDLEGGFFGTFTHALLVGVAKVHSSKAYWGDSDVGSGSELAMAEKR